MAICRIFETEDDGYVLFTPPRGMPTASDVKLFRIERLLYEFDARSMNDACRKRNELLGWEEYKPMLDGEEWEAPFKEDLCFPDNPTSTMQWLLERLP